MIRSSSIAIGELIAVGGYSLRPSQLIQGLNEVSVSSFPFTPENFRQEIEIATSQSTHTDILEATSTRLAEIIRETMETVRTYGIPLADAVVAATSLMYNRKELRSVAGDAISIQFVNADDPFFDSPLFPNEVADDSLSYQNISLSQLETLRFDYASIEQLNSFINTNHPDVREVLDSPDASLSEAADLLTNIHSLKEVFTHNGDLFNFQQVKSSNINLLLKAYILLTKMKGEDDPVSWLKGGDLGTYRAYVNTLWNGFTAYLLQLRGVIQVYRAQKLTLLQDKEVTLSNDFREFKKARYLCGKVRVFYTNDVINAVTEGNLSFQEVIMGFFWARLNGRGTSITELVANLPRVVAEANDYFDSIHRELTAEGRQLFVNGGLKAIEKFLDDHPRLMSRIEDSGATRGKIFDSWLYDVFYEDLSDAFSVTSETCSSDDVLSTDELTQVVSERAGALLSTRFVPNFLRVVGCSLAADLITDTFVMSEGDTVANKRERMGEAIINLIVKKSVE